MPLQIKLATLFHIASLASLLRCTFLHLLDTYPQWIIHLLKSWFLQMMSRLLKTTACYNIPITKGLESFCCLFWVGVVTAADYSGKQTRCWTFPLSLWSDRRNFILWLHKSINFTTNFSNPILRPTPRYGIQVEKLSKAPPTPTSESWQLLAQLSKK